MPRIADPDVSVFREAYGFISNHLTEEEVREISALAQRLRAIIETANQREQEYFKKMGLI